MAVGEGYDAGKAWLQILPSFENVDAELKKVAKDIADGLNKSLADAMPDGVKASAKATAKEAEKVGEAAGEKSAEKFAGHFADTLTRQMRKAQRALPEVVIDADSSPFDTAVAKVRKQMEALAGKKFGVDITPAQAIGDSRDISGQLRNLRGQTGDERLRVDLSQAADEVDAWVEVAQAGGEKMAVEAKRAADEWNRIHQAALDENERRQRKAADDFVKLWQHAHQEDLRRTYLILQEQGRIHEQAIGEDQKREYVAARERGRIHENAIGEDQKREYVAARERVRIHENALQEDLKRDYDARKKMAQMHEQAIADDHKRTKKAVQDAARVVEQEFARTVAGKIQAELSRVSTILPDLGMRPARDDVEQTVKDIRSRIETLRNQRIGIDIDADKAFREIAGIQAELLKLANSSPNVEVKADAVLAAARLTAVERIADRLDGRNINVQVNADASAIDNIGKASTFALSRLEGLVFLGLSLGTTLIPAAGAAASAIGFIGAAAVSAAAGIGVLALGFSGIGGAVQALNKYQQQAQKSAVAVAAAQDRVASATDSVSSAQRSLANARASAAEGARRAAQQVTDAERSVADARRGALDAVRSANDRLAGAERDKTRAELDAREAREGLTQAYRDAVSALADLNSQVKRNALDQRQATLDLKDAQEELAKFLANPRATQEEREQAKITYERRVQQIADLKRQGQELAAQQDEANKKGVAGSDQVVAARKRIAEADQRVSDAQRTVESARRAVVQAQLDGAQRVADAERRVGEARRAAAEQQRQAASSIVQAQQGVISAQRQLGQAIDKTSVAGGEALSNLQQAMDNLSPAGRRFAQFIFGLKPAFDSLRATAAENMLPGVQSSIENLLPFLPRFQGFVGRVAGAIGGLFDSTSKLLTTDPTWRKFWGYTNSQTVPTLERLYRIASNTATGVIGLFLAFTPFNDDIGGGLEKLTADFAKWSASLATNQGFQKMLGYIRENGPAVIDLLGNLIQFVGRFVVAVAPIGSFVVDVFDKLFTVINLIPMPILQALIIGIASLSAVILGLNAAMRLAEIRRQTFAKIADTFDSVQLAGMLAAEKVGRGMDHIGARSDAAGRAMGRLKTAGSKMKTGLSTAADFLTGPWGIAIAGAGLAIDYLSSKQGEQTQKVKDLTAALGLLGDAYKETRDLSSTAVKEVIAQSQELQNLINNAGLYGLAVEDIAKAAAGEADAQERVIDALAKKREWYVANSIDSGGQFAGGYEREIAAIDTVSGALEIQFQRTSAVARAQEALDAAQQRTARRTPGLTDAQFALSEKLGLNGEKIAALKGLLDTFSDAQATAADRANALRRAIEAQTAAKISAIEAEEAEARARRGLTGSIEENRSALQSQVDAGKLSAAQADKMSRSLSVNTEEGDRNRDALEAAAGAVRDRYLADIESGMPMEEATRLFKERLAALISNTKTMGFDEKKAKELIEVYGNVDPAVTTVYQTKGFETVFAELEQLQFAQFALEAGLNPKAAAALWKAQKQGGYGGNPALFKADGGHISGPGTATSDSIPAWLSNGEFVQPAASVDFYGQGFMELLRRRALPKDLIPGFASGGAVKWPFETNALMTRVPSMDEVRAIALKSMIGGASTGGIGSADQMRLLRAVFPGLPLYSGYRPGSRTPSGNLSYHGMIAADGDKGRAVDLPPRQDVFDYIHDNYMSGTRELIWLGDKYRNIWNGKHHKFSDSLLANHGTAGMPNAHLHWAYDQGGYLPPGVTTVYNGTGKPEPVFTDGQFQDIAALARNGHAEAHETHNWNFKTAALDHGRLQAWADARDARARPGRPN